MSTDFPTPPPARANLTFSFSGLAAREETLFKSFVRLLDHRTQHHWSWRADGADLVVVPQGRETDSRARALATLTLCNPGTPAAPGNHLTLPIHADALETELNLLGALIQGRRSWSTSAPVAALSAAAVRLIRWPSAALLNSRERLRLAALMTGSPMTLAQLRQRSGFDERVCSDFFDELQHAGLLSAATPAAAPGSRAPARSPAPAQGLLARIRMRLGLSFTQQP